MIVVLLAVIIPYYYNSTSPRYLGLRVLHSIVSIKHSLLPDPNRPMLSAQYRAFESMLSRRPIAEIDPNAEPLQLARKIREAFPLDKVVPRSSTCHVDKHEYQYDGHKVDTHWIHHERSKPKLGADRIILYFHGGGYIAGDIQGM